MNKLILSLMLVMICISFVSAEQDSLGTFEKDNSITLIQICGTCTYNNITSIVYPNGTHVSIDEEMVKRGMEYTYGWNDTGSIGTYLVNGVGDLDGTDNAWAYEFEVTLNSIDEGNNTFIWIILALAVLLLLLGFWKEDPTILLLGSFILTLMGLYFLLYGISGIKNMATTYSISIILLMVGAYISLRSSYELIITDNN